MKKTYDTPKLTTHGTVEELTKAEGISSAQDAILFGGQLYGGYTDGSRDIILP